MISTLHSSSSGTSNTTDFGTKIKNTSINHQQKITLIIIRFVLIIDIFITQTNMIKEIKLVMLGIDLKHYKCDYTTVVPLLYGPPPTATRHIRPDSLCTL